MKEHSILFSAPMVRAILEGRKTQTRRVAKLNSSGRVSLGGRNWHCGDINAHLACRYGQPGDRLWVKETTYNVEDDGWVGPCYVESDEGRQAAEWGYGESDDPYFIEPFDLKKRPSLFMGRSKSRILLEVANVRIERLNTISEEDAIAEGIDAALCAQFTTTAPSRFELKPAAVHAYAGLWESINGSNSWAVNPFVWVIEFTRIQP